MLCIQQRSCAEKFQLPAACKKLTEIGPSFAPQVYEMRMASDKKRQAYQKQLSPKVCASYNSVKVWQITTSQSFIQKSSTLSKVLHKDFSSLFSFGLRTVCLGAMCLMFDPSIWIVFEIFSQLLISNEYVSGRNNFLLQHPKIKVRCTEPTSKNSKLR